MNNPIVHVSKQFLELQPRLWKEVYKIYIERAAASTSEEMLAHLSAKIEEFGFSPSQSSAAAASLLSHFASLPPEQFVESTNDEAILSTQDITLLKEKLLHEASPELRRLLTAFLIYARVNPHPSFWIKYERKVIFFLASLDKKSVSEQIYLTNQLHSLYNLDMRVVGSNQPIPCFKIMWQAEEPPLDTSDNSLVLLGPLSPATVKMFAQQLPYEPLPKED